MSEATRLSRQMTNADGGESDDSDDGAQSSDSESDKMVSGRILASQFNGREHMVAPTVGQESSVALFGIAQAPADETVDNQSSSMSEREGLPIGFHSLQGMEAIDIPSYIDEHTATLSFPEKLMLMLMHIDKVHAKSGKTEASKPIGWVLDGHAFGIYCKEELVRTWLPRFFRQTKFSSFTRKLYRWGFRQVQIEGGSRVTNAKYFGNENFRRNNKELLTKMRSVTAAGTRREEASKEPPAPSPTDVQMPVLIPSVNAPHVQSIPPSATTLTLGLQLGDGRTVPISLQVPPQQSACTSTSTIPQQPQPQQGFPLAPSSLSLLSIMSAMQPHQQHQPQQIAQAQPWVLQQAIAAAQNLVSQNLSHQPVQDLARNRYILTLSRVDSSNPEAPQVHHLAQSQILPTDVNPSHPSSQQALPTPTIATPLPAVQPPPIPGAGITPDGDHLRGLLELLLMQQQQAGILPPHRGLHPPP